MAVSIKGFDFGKVVLEKTLDGWSGRVSASDPDHFWRRAFQEAQLVEVAIFGNEMESIGFCVFPDEMVVCGSESAFVNMRRSREKGAKVFHEFWRKIFVKQEFHAAVA